MGQRITKQTMDAVQAEKKAARQLFGERRSILYFLKRVMTAATTITATATSVHF